MSEPAGSNPPPMTGSSTFKAPVEPLGYRYIGQSGDSIGLGVESADLFLTQEPRGASISPVHVAFRADSRLTVRNCYANALRSGGYPSGAPSYRDGACTVFNAAVEDLDGNVIEFIFNEGASSEENLTAITPLEQSQVTTWQKDVASRSIRSDARQLSSQVSRAKSRAQTAMDLASSTSRSMRSGAEPPVPRIRRVRTAPVTTGAEFPSKAFLGTLAAAGVAVAVAYATSKSERGSARDEAEFAASVNSRNTTRRSLDDSHDSKMHRDYSVTESRPSRTHRNLSASDVGRSKRAIEPREYYYDNEIQDAVSRYTPSRRPRVPMRSRTTDAIGYEPRRSSSYDQAYRAIDYRSKSTVSRDSRHNSRRPSTVLDDRPNYYLDAPRSVISGHNGSRARRSSYDDQNRERRDSVISARSHHSRQASETSRRSSASTIKPSRRKSSRHGTATEVNSYMSAARVPIPESHDGGWTEEDSDGLSDMRTVVPDDSISCVDFSRPRSSHRSSQAKSRQYDRDSDAADSERTARAPRREGSRHSAMTLPVRSKAQDRGSRPDGRSAFTYA